MSASMLCMIAVTWEEHSGSESACALINTRHRRDGVIGSSPARCMVSRIVGSFLRVSAVFLLSVIVLTVCWSAAALVTSLVSLKNRSTACHARDPGWGSSILIDEIICPNVSPSALTRQ